jgi:prepilin-type N-terminal cleavage/methylation domain-containing protein
MTIVRRRNPVARAFTLIELVAVIVVLTILSGIAIPKYFDYAAKGKEKITRDTLNVVRSAVDRFHANSAATNAATTNSAGNGAAAYPTLAQMQTLGAVLQEPIPANPYNNSATIALSTWNTGSPPVAGTAGWNYDPTVGRFWANSNTAGINENQW